jgi:hypothetical protein
MINKEMIMDLVNNNPLSLLVIKDKETIDYINNLIPYSSAFEIECDMVGNPKYGSIEWENHNNTFKAIPDIMAVSNDTNEQRYRIPNGLKGIICLFNICTQLKMHSLLNPLSSIHYHVDCTDYWGEAFKDKVIRNQDWILSELDTWLGNDIAINRSMECWFKINDLKTIEFRLGEMTFDYRIILKRIMHCNSMVRKFKDEMYITPIIFKELDSNKILNYLKTVSYSNVGQMNKINNLKKQVEALQKPKEKVELVIPVELPPTIRSRTHIFKPSN